MSSLYGEIERCPLNVNDPEIGDVSRGWNSISTGRNGVLRGHICVTNPAKRGVK